LLRGRMFNLKRNWNPTIDWLNARQLKVPSKRATKEISKHHNRIRSVLLRGIIMHPTKPKPSRRTSPSREF
jgi:hypothetical protein